MSPDSVGRCGKNVDYDGGMLSPKHGRPGIFTEPRNYAPRTAGLPVLASSEPPPKFNLSMAVASSNEEPRGNVQDTLYADAHYDHRYSSSALVSFTSDGKQTLHDQIRSMRSDHLNGLTATNTGLPSFHIAMQPENFPFLEGARQAVPVNYGVVKLKNVSSAAGRQCPG